MATERTGPPRVWRIRVNGRPLGTVAVRETGRRRAVETAAMRAPEVCAVIGERTVRSVAGAAALSSAPRRRARDGKGGAKPMGPTRAATRILLAGALLAGAASSTAAPRVVVSLAPLHSLVAGVMAGIATPELVVRGAGSPHTYALRPSDAARLAQADLVVWVGEPLEIFLVRPLAALAPGTSRLRLLGLDGLVLHPSRPGGEHHDEGHAAGHAEPAHAGGGVDAHLWLDPRNAIVVVRAAAARLADLDAANAPAYAANARAVEARIRTLDAALERRLAPLRSVPFVVFHDAFQYFERRYRLAAAGAVTLSPERLPGARRVIALRERIRALGARCVFREPQFPSPLLDTILEGTGAREGVIDPLGSAVAPGPDAWFETMERLADGFERCLGGG